MKVAITGAQSTGKSTLLRFLKNDEELKGFEFIDELLHNKNYFILNLHQNFL